MQRHFLLLGVLFIIIISLFIVFAQPDLPPQLPMILSGNVTINGEPAPIGTIVSARIENEIVSSYNLTKSGEYTLLVPEKGNEFTIYVDNLKTNQTLEWKSGEIRTLNLNVSKGLPYFYLIIALIVITIIGVIRYLKFTT